MSFLDRGDLERILGWHDGSKVSVRSSALVHPVVQAHEAVHGRIFAETADGELHRVCCIAAGTTYDKANDSAYTDLANALFQETREAHEAAATYLSIQGMPTAELRQSSYEMLPPDYRAYYGLLDDLFRDAPKTTWLRYAFGWSLVHWTFYSRRNEVFFEDVAPRPSLVRAIASPSDRLRGAIEFLSSRGRLEEWVHLSLDQAKKAYLAKGLDLWDLENEEEWNERASSPEARILEDCLTAAAGSWLLENAPFDTSDFRVKRSRLGPGFDNLMTALNWDWVVHFRHENSTTDTQSHREDVERRARQHGADQIDHAPQVSAIDLSPMEAIDAFKIVFEPLRQCSDLFILSYPGDSESCLLLLRDRAESGGMFDYVARGTFLVTNAVAASIVQSRRDPVLWEEAKLDKMWLMVSVEDGQYDEAVLRAWPLSCDLIAPSDTEKGPNFLIEQENIIFYWHGNWTDIYQTPDIAVASIPIGLIDSDGETGKPVSLCLAQAPSLFPSVLACLKSPWAGFQLSQYEAQLINDGELNALELPEPLPDALSYLPALLSAWHVWPRF